MNELTTYELTKIDAGHGSWNGLGEIVSGVGGGVIGGCVSGAVWGSAAGPVGAAAGALIGGGVYWVLE